jgi:glycosyltransferase involved in cell wall biosynthesis
MKVNIAVCGRFHYHNYVKYIHDSGYLKTFYFSHKLSSGRKIGIPKKNYLNGWIKEYLLHFHSRKLSGIGKDFFYPLYHYWWEKTVLFNWTQADVWHIMLHGTSNKIIQRAKREGSVVIGEAVNTHPLTMNRLLQEEYDRLGIKQKVTLSRAQKKQLEEIEKVDYILAPSEFVKNSFVQHGFNAQKIKVLPYGANLSRFYKFPLEDTEKEKVFEVLCVSQISIRKGHIDLLQAWKELALPNARLILIGAIVPEVAPILEKYKGIYTHLGIVPNERLIKYYNNASVFVLSSIEEGCSVVPLEAMACGTPVILSNHTGTHELIQPDKEGWVYEARDKEALKRLLLYAYNNPEALEVAGRACEKKVKESSNWEQYATSLVEHYKKSNS